MAIVIKFTCNYIQTQYLKDKIWKKDNDIEFEWQDFHHKYTKEYRNFLKLQLIKIADLWNRNINPRYQDILKKQTNLQINFEIDQWQFDFIMNLINTDLNDKTNDLNQNRAHYNNDYQTKLMNQIKMITELKTYLTHQN